MTNAYKQYKRNRRQTTLEQDFSKGMMFNGGTVDFSYAKMLVNYNTYNDKSTLVPRAGLQLSGLIFPDFDMDSFDDPEVFTYHGTDVSIKDAKECVETDGVTYKQFILGRSNSSEGDGRVYVITSPISDVKYASNVIKDFELNLSVMNKDYIASDASYLVTELNEIHGIELKEDSKVSSLIGSFAFGNNYYFINPTTNKLCCTEFSSENKRYEIKELEPKAVDPSEAVTYGYNMLLGDEAYNFKNGNYEGSIIQLTGILPYDSGDSKALLMTPKKNQDITFKCFCKAPADKTYKFVWEWRTVEASEWAIIEETSPSKVTADTELSVTFKPPAADIMIRVQAYNVEDETTVEKAMTVGFDFSVDNENGNLNPDFYDLTTVTGIVYWKNRLVVWGVEKDPTILFMSDVNEPTYFPYPNNISVFDDPIVSVKPYMDYLLVFTTSQVYQVSLNEDGTGWTSTLLQSNLYIQPWDRHLIQIVRNMVFFKSGNYYYMIVPKAQSTTGELTLAPVSTPIVEFFNNFEKNVEEMLKDVFNYTGLFDVVHYYNFLDYEYIHNIYVLDYEDELENYLHLDVMYNTVNRSWKIHTFDAPHFLYPYKNDATQVGTLAATSLIKIYPSISAQNTLIQVEEPILNANKTNVVYITDSIDPLVFFSAPTFRVSYNNTYVDFSTVGATAEGDIVRLTKDNLCFELSLIEGVYSKLYTLDNTDEFECTGYLVAQCIGETKTAQYALSVIPEEKGLVEYPFKTGSIHLGTVVEINNIRYELNSAEHGWLYNGSNPYVFKVRASDAGYTFMFPDSTSYREGPVVKVYDVSEDQDPVIARCIQLYKFNGSDMTDIFLPANSEIVFDVDTIGDSTLKYSTGSISYAIMELINNQDKYMKFKNWQFIDTGYREDNIHLNKRFRELQLQLNNIEGSNLEFSMEFKLNGTTRRRYYMYEVEQVLDENDPDYGLLSIQSTPYSNVILRTESVLNETTLATYPEQDVEEFDTWRLDQSKFPDVNLWRVRMHISGKGQAPRMKLLSRNQAKYELMGLNWVYRVMNMR